MSWKLIKQESIKSTNITTLLIYHIFIKDNSIRKDGEINYKAFNKTNRTRSYLRIACNFIYSDKTIKKQKRKIMKDY
jgi:hypothetical protein